MTLLIPQMFTAWAQRSPEAVAVSDGERVLTYRQLYDAAIGAAIRVRQAGLGRDEVVGLLCGRGIDGLAGMLGIMLSGAACLYLDPSWPQDRRAHMTDECRVSLTLTDGERLTFNDLPLALGVQARDLCYVVYTSGSTGAPKGVAVEHGGAGNMAHRLARAFSVSPGVRVLQFANWAWDAAACEILVTLCAGGTLVLAPEWVRQGGEPLAEFLRVQRIQVATLTPSVLSALPDGDLPDLQTLVAVGEACSPGLVSRWAPGRRFLNGYGPSEATVAVSVGRCRPGAPITIGKPLRGVRVRVVDDNGAPVPQGHPGELMVGGTGVARGYVTLQANSYRGPAVTSGGKFLESNGHRWYLTGDLVHQEADGRLVYHGRTDSQVKVRGHRIELSEVEHGMMRHPGIRACAVTVNGGRLVAHVVPAQRSVSTEDVLEHASRWLPEFMLPSQILTVESLPLNGNGKLDRAALETDHEVLDLIRETLENSDIGPDEDVIEAGGHSLVAAQLAVAVTQHFGVPITALQIYDHPTAEKLASLIHTLTCGD